MRNVSIATCSTDMIIIILPRHARIIFSHLPSLLPLLSHGWMPWDASGMCDAARHRGPDFGTLVIGLVDFVLGGRPYMTSARFQTFLPLTTFLSAFKTDFYHQISATSPYFVRFSMSLLLPRECTSYISAPFLSSGRINTEIITKPVSSTHKLTVYRLAGVRQAGAGIMTADCRLPVANLCTCSLRRLVVDGI